MNSRQIIDKAIAFEPVPRVPVAVLDGHMWIGAQNGLSPEQMGGMDDEEAVKLILASYDEIGSDLVFTSAGYYMALHDVVARSCGVEPMSKESPDASSILALDADEVCSKLDAHPALVSQRRRIELMNAAVSDEKYIMAFSLAPLTMVSTLVGMESLMTDIIEEPETVEALMEFGMKVSAYIVADELKHGATAISMADPVSSSEVISEEMFRDLSFPALKKACAGWRAYKCPVMLHICGNSTPRLKDIRELDIDIFSLDGGSIEEELDIARGAYAIFGNLSTVDVMMNDSAENVSAKAEALCQAAGLGGGFILAPGCDLPPATPKQNVLAMTSAALG